MKKVTFEKVDMDFSNYDKELDVFGQKFHVRKAISRAEKDEAAMEIIARGVNFDEDLGIQYKAVNFDAVNRLIRVKYYTDIDVDPYYTEEDLYELYDMLSASDAWDEIFHYTLRDGIELSNVVDGYLYTFAKIFERRHTLDFTLRKMLTSVEDQSQQAKIVAEAADVNAQLIRMFDAFRAQNKDNKGKPQLDAGVFAKRDLPY